jgi:hypothetical protein
MNSSPNEYPKIFPGSSKILQMIKFQPSIEHLFYGLALSLAICLRFLNLGSLPLSNFEAEWALQALHVSQGLQPAVGPNPAYVHLTAALFYIFGSSNFLARFWPALAGTILVITPWFLRSWVGHIPAIVLALGLAIDPGLVAMSHLAGGPILAITCLFLTGLMWFDKHRSLAGFFAGLALLSGSSTWLGIIGLALTWAFTSTMGSINPKPIEERTKEDELRDEPSPHLVAQIQNLHWSDFRTSLAWGLGTIIVLGSMFTLSPKGLPAIVMSFIEFLRGWWTLSDVPSWKLLLALPAYEILPLGFGIAGFVRCIRMRDHVSIRFGVWTLVAIILAVIYPGKQTGDLTWVIVPLWILAAIELGQHFDFEDQNFWGLAGVITLVCSLLVFGWLNLASMTAMDLNTQQARMRLYLILVVVIFIGLSLLLVGAGWSPKRARLGGVWGGVLGLTAFTLAMSTGAAGLREPLTFDLWQPEPRTGRVDILLKVANQISDLNTGYQAQLPITFLNVDSQALHWLFRDWKIQDVMALEPDSKPELVISSVDQLNLAADYRGEALPLTEISDWENASTSSWLKWFVYRQMPLARQEIIFWVRSDLMLDSQGVPAP